MAASLHLISLEATETTRGPGAGDILPKYLDFQLRVRGRFTLSLCGGGYSGSCSRLWTPEGEVQYPSSGGAVCTWCSLKPSCRLRK